MSDGAAAVEPEVTVVIPTRDRLSLLRRTLRTVLAQTGVRLRVIVVDDGGSDGTAEAVRKLGDDRITVVRHDLSRGVSAARNTGVDAVSTPWIAFLNDDDLWAPDKLSAQMEALAAAPDAGWSCVGAVHTDWRYRELLLVGAPHADGLAERLLASMVIPGGGSGVVVKTDLLRAVGGFDESLRNIEDWDCYIRLALSSRLAPVNRPLLGFYEHRSAVSTNVRRAEVEYGYINEKYTEERRARGVRQARLDRLAYLPSAPYLGRGGAWGVRLYLEVFRMHPSIGTALRIAKRLAPPRIQSLQRIVARSSNPHWDRDLKWLRELRRDPANRMISDREAAS